MKKTSNVCLLHIYISVITLLFGISHTYAQDTSSTAREHHYWYIVGLGPGTSGLSLGINFSYQTEKNIISIRYIYSEELVFLGHSPAESVAEVGILYGIIAKAPYGFVSVSGGIGYVSVVRRGSYLGSSGWFSFIYEKHTFHTFGIPLEGQLNWRPLSFLGVGLYAAANLNSQRSFAAVLICLQVGDLR